MKRLPALAAAFLPSLALAFWHCTSAAESAGLAQVGLGNGDLFTAQSTTNLLSVLTSNYTVGINDPSVVDAEGYPVRNFSGLIGGQIGAVSQKFYPSPATYQFGWDAGRSCFKVNFSTSGIASGVVGSPTITNGGGRGNLSIQGSCGVAGSVIISFNGVQAITFTFDGTYSRWGSNSTGKMWLARNNNTGWNGQSDLVAYKNGIFWTKEQVDLLKASGANSLRPMGLTAIYNLVGYSASNVVNWSYRKPASGMSFVNQDFPPGTRCGGAHAFCNIAVSSSNQINVPSPSDDGTSNWVDGEQITGSVVGPVFSSVGSIKNVTVATVPGGINNACQFTVSGSTAEISQGMALSIKGVLGISGCNGSGTPGKYTTFLRVYSVDSGTTFTAATMNSKYTSSAVVSGTYTSGGSISRPWLSNSLGYITAVSSNAGNCQFAVSGTSELSPGMPVAIDGITSTATECNTPPPTTTTILSVDDSTHFTINVTKSNGTTYTGKTGMVAYQSVTVSGKSVPKLIKEVRAIPQGYPYGMATIPNGPVTLTYNATLDAVIITIGGLSNSLPIEAIAQLANLSNIPIWYTSPFWANDGYIAGEANLFYSVLNPNLSHFNEVGNEIWNFGQQAAVFAAQMSVARGLAAYPGNALTYQGFRTRQVFGLLESSNWSADLSRLKRGICFQNAGHATSIVAMMTGVGLGAYGYDKKPNRLIDKTEFICTAPYTGGGTALSQFSPDAAYTPTVYDAPLINAIGAAMSSGDSKAAVSLVDQSVRGDYLNRVQTVTASGTTFTTPRAHNFAVNDVLRFTVTGGTTYSGLDLKKTCQVIAVTLTTFSCGLVTRGARGSALNAGNVGTGVTSVGYLDSNVYSSHSIFGQINASFTKWQDVAVNGFSPVPSGGTPGIRWYEGSLEVTAPAARTCTSIGVSPLTISGTAVCGTRGWVDQAIAAWRNTLSVGVPGAAATLKYFYQGFMGTNPQITLTYGNMSQSKSTSNLILNGGGVYGLMATDSHYSNPVPTGFFTGFQNFNQTGPEEKPW
jgi:hypothetical protein